MSDELFAVTANGYRAVTASMPLSAGETVLNKIPPELLSRINVQAAKAERSELLRATDWTQMGDASLTAAQKVSMATYRQALRDLPSLPGFPNVPWPVMPVLSEGAAGAIAAK